MSEECSGLFKFYRLAAFVVEHAEELPECLPLLREVFVALSTAECKVEVLKQSIFAHYKKNRKKSSKSSVVGSEDYEENSTVVSSSFVAEYFTEAEDGEPVKDERESNGVGLVENTENEIETDPPQLLNGGQSKADLVHSPPIQEKNRNTKEAKVKKKKEDDSSDELLTQLASTPAELPTVGSEELKVDTCHVPINLLLNTVTDEEDPLKRRHSEALTGTSSSRDSSLPPTKRLKHTSSESEIPSSVPQLEDEPLTFRADDHKEPPQTSTINEPSSHHCVVKQPTIKCPGWRVIPSVLLMEKPEQLDSQPSDGTSNKSGSPDFRGYDDFALGNGNIVSADCNTVRPKPTLYFELSRMADNRSRLSESDIISAMKRDPAIRKYWITVENMKRSLDLITGYLIFPDLTSCYRAQVRGFQVNGCRAMLTPVDAVADHGSFAEDGSNITSSTRSSTPHQTEPGFQSFRPPSAQLLNESFFKRQTSEHSQLQQLLQPQPMRQQQQAPPQKPPPLLQPPLQQRPPPQRKPPLNLQSLMELQPSPPQQNPPTLLQPLPQPQIDVKTTKGPKRGKCSRGRPRGRRGGSGHDGSNHRGSGHDGSNHRGRGHKGKNRGVKGRHPGTDN